MGATVNTNIDGVAEISDLAQDDFSAVAGRILYVEDNLASQKLMEGIVNLSEGLSLLSARYADVGLELAKTQSPDMIILDINLPDMSGFEALEILKNLKITPRIPVIALSAYASDQDIKKGIDAGFVRYLTKPLNLRQVQRVFQSLLAVY